MRGTEHEGADEGAAGHADAPGHAGVADPSDPIGAADAGPYAADASVEPGRTGSAGGPHTAVADGVGGVPVGVPQAEPYAAAAPWGVPDHAQAYAGGQAAGPVPGWPAGPAGTAYDPGLPPPALPRHGPFGPPPPPRAPHRWGLGAYLLVEVVFLVVSALLGYLLGSRLTSSAGAIALALSVPTLCAAGLAVLITRIRGNGPVVDLGLRLTPRDVGIGVACGLAGLMITIPASVLYVAIVGTDATSAVGEVLGDVRAGPALAVTIFLIVVFVAPLCEEIVYRGLLWGAVERLGANRWWALVITTVVFALAHFEFTRTPLLLVVAIPIGIARVITGRLSAGVIAHQINNLLPGIVLMLGVLGAVPLT